MGTHNLCFEAKIRKIGIPLHTLVLYKSGGLRGYTLHGHVFMMLSSYYAVLEMKVDISNANWFGRTRTFTILYSRR